MTSVETGRPAILLVDDEPALLKLMAIKLGRVGWEVHTAPDAATALHIAEGLRCGLNLLVTDIQMPGMPGDELIRQIRAVCPRVDVLAISGALPEASAGFANIPYLKKPFGMQQLIEAAQGLLASQL